MHFASIFAAALVATVASARAVVPAVPADAAGIVARDTCPDPFSSCQYQDSDGCVYGYSACLQKWGCSGAAGGADCIGIAFGKLPREEPAFLLFCSHAVSRMRHRLPLSCDVIATRHSLEPCMATRPAREWLTSFSVRHGS